MNFLSSNSTGFLQLLIQTLSKAIKMYDIGAFLHSYTRFGATDDDFKFAFESVQCSKLFVIRQVQNFTTFLSHKRLCVSYCRLVLFMSIDAAALRSNRIQSKHVQNVPKLHNTNRAFIVVDQPNCENLKSLFRQKVSLPWW